MRSFVQGALAAILLPLWPAAGQDGQTPAPNQAGATQAAENRSSDNLPSAYATGGRGQRGGNRRR